MAQLTTTRGIFLAGGPLYPDLIWDSYVQTGSSPTALSFRYTLGGVAVFDGTMTGSFDLSTGSGTLTGFTYSQPAGAAFLTLSGLNLPFASSDELNDRLQAATLLSGNDAITGSAFTDVLMGYAGNDSIDAGGGYDQVAYLGRYLDYTIERNGSVVTVSGPGGTDVLTNVERIRFADFIDLGVVPGIQTARSSLVGESGGVAVTVEQVPISPVEDPVRGTLTSEVQINGTDPAGGPAQLKEGWEIGTLADLDADGRSEIFFFSRAGEGQGAGLGASATWELNAQGQIVGTQTQWQMRVPGWDVAGAADVNGIPGDEILLQNMLTGAKAVWTDTNRDGAIDAGYTLPAISGTREHRLVGVTDLDRDGAEELLRFNDATGSISAWEARPGAAGVITLGPPQTFPDAATFVQTAQATGATYEFFPFLV
ncbi:hypothetical protein [Arenibaculum pallidiluteum]|uniref:hypothetical protein n=1 Tax=Arenibaculum pallidiluteum TaxID=2812559 RepID=UPI001A971F0B|nr:hypothetical protein [Arenibaculum pallidiluteum]